MCWAVKRSDHRRAGGRPYPGAGMGTLTQCPCQAPAARWSEVVGGAVREPIGRRGERRAYRATGRERAAGRAPAVDPAARGPNRRAHR